MAFDAAMRIFELTKQFPTEEKYSLTDQIRRASRSVCGSIAEAWRRRRYEAAFVNKINEAEGEAAETQTWIQFSVKCGYVQKVTGKELYETYDQIIGKLVRMLTHRCMAPQTPIKYLSTQISSSPHPSSRYNQTSDMTHFYATIK